MNCCHCGDMMFTAQLVQVEKVTEGQVYKHLYQRDECGNCGVIYTVFIPALELTKVLSPKGKGR